MAESDLIRGNVDTIILKVLYEGDRYGYDLIRQINARSNGQWEIKQPTVYACLKRLEKQGFITSYWDTAESDGGRRKYYSLTESGKDVFLKYKSEFERANALLGGIIGGDEPKVFIHPDDDYSDVEDEGYALPKRRPQRKRADKPVAQTVTTDEPPIEENIVEEPVPTAAEEITAPEPTEQDKTDGAVIPDEQQPVPEQQQPQYSQPQQQYAPQDLFSYIATDMPTPVDTLDAQAIIAQKFSEQSGESYSDVHSKMTYNDTPKAAPAPVPAPAPQPVNTATAPAPVPVQPAPMPAQPVQPAPKQVIPVTPAAPPAPVYTEQESQARREYKTVLSDLVERFEVTPPFVREQPAAEQAAAAPAAQATNAPKFSEIRAAARELGNDITIREHNDSARQYTSKYFYYSNKLLLTHYTMMCATMFLLGMVLFLTFYLGLGMRLKYDFLLYIGAGLLPIAMFVTAIIMFVGNPDKTKKINVNFKFSIIIRIVIMLQVAVVIYCLNLIWGMPVGFSVDYLPSLIIPAVYALFIPISQIIFGKLLLSGNYAADDYQ